MKKFLVLSVIVGLAGIGVGIAGRQPDPAPIVETAIEAPTTTAASALITSTTARKVATKATVKATTTTRPAAVASPTTVATGTAPMASTTSPTLLNVSAIPTTSTTAKFKPACSLAVEQPTIAPGGTQVIRMTSNMPNVSAGLGIKGANAGRVMTDSNGNASWQFAAPTTPGVVSVTTSFVFPLTHQTIGSVCSSTFVVA